jgi:hypothetical protein
MFTKLFVGTALALGLTLTAAPIAGAAEPAGPASEAPADNAECAHGQWPAGVEGRPAQLVPGATGVFLWHDGTGWHLRATEAGKDKAVFTGQVKADGRVYSVARRTEGHDKVTHTGRPNDVTYRFTNYGHIDGLDFKVRCGTKLEVKARLDGRTINEGLVFIGADGHHPAGVPFVINR